jgi:predicted transcriptional regulator
MDRADEQPTRRLILDFIATHPGASAREVQRQLDLGWGETAYHLDRLIQAGTLFRDRAGRRDYYFTSSVAFEDRRLLVALQSPVERAILLELATPPSRTFAEMVVLFGMSKSTIAFHLRYLLGLELIEITMSGGTRRYSTRRGERIREVVRQYRGSWGNRWVDRFSSTWGGLLRK